MLNTLYKRPTFPSPPTDRQIANANHLFFSSLAESALSGGGAAAASARRRANRGCTDANIFPPGRAFVRRLAGDGGTLFVRGLRKMTDRSFSDIPSSTMRELSGCMISHSGITFRQRRDISLVTSTKIFPLKESDNLRSRTSNLTRNSTMQVRYAPGK